RRSVLIDGVWEVIQDVTFTPPDPATGAGWVITEAGFSETQESSYDVDTDETTVITTRSEVGGETRVSAEVFREVKGQRELVRRLDYDPRDPGLFDRPTTYAYTDDGQLELVVQPGGSWVRYVYDPNVSGRVAREIRQF